MNPRPLATATATAARRAQGPQSSWWPQVRVPGLGGGSRLDLSIFCSLLIIFTSHPLPARAVGIPARIAGCSESIVRGDDHHWVEFFDPSSPGPFNDSWHTKEGVRSLSARQHSPGG